MQNIPKGHEPIFSEVEYSDFRNLETLESYIRNELSVKTYINKKDLHFLIEQKLGGLRPGKKYYVGGEIMFIIKYIEPRTSIFHDMVLDTELCILHPQHFSTNDLNSLINKIKNDGNEI